MTNTSCDEYDFAPSRLFQLPCKKLIVGLIFIVFIVDAAITRTSISRECISIAATFVAIVIASLPSSSQPLVADVTAFADIAQRFWARVQQYTFLLRCLSRSRHVSR